MHGDAGLEEVSVHERRDAHEVLQNTPDADDDVVVVHDLLDSADGERRSADGFDGELVFLRVTMAREVVPRAVHPPSSPPFGF